MTTDPTTTGSADELAALRAEVADLRRALETLTTAPPSADRRRAPNPAIVERPSSRRQLLRRAGLAGSAAVAGGLVLHARPAAAGSAANGQNLTAGEVNNATQTTEIRTNPATIPRSHVFVAHDGVWGAQSPAGNDSTTAAVGGFAGATVRHGGYFQTNGFLGAGVRAFANKENSIGGWFRGPRAAILLEPPGEDLPSPPDRSGPVEHSIGELAVDDSGDLWFCIAGGAPGGWRKLAGPSTAGSLHLLASPQRVYDSRVGTEAATVGPKIPLAGGTPRTIDVTSGAAEVRADATGVLLTVTATSTTAGGYLTVWRAETPWPGTSSLNWTGPQQTVATTTVSAATNGRIQLLAETSTDVIVDVIGYYR